MGSASNGGPGPEKRSSLWRPALALSTSGAVLLATIGGGALLGLWLDGKFETKPWLLIGGILLGTAAGFVQMFRMAKRFLK